MATKPKKKPAAKKSSSKSVKSKVKGVGHNSHKNPAVIKIFDEYISIDEKKKEMSKHQRQIKARAKDEFGISKRNFDHEIRMQKMDEGARAEFEVGSQDLKGMLGIQLSLNLVSPDNDDGAGEDSDDPEALAARLAGEEAA